MKKVALVTGAYRGLGLETVRQLLDRGYEVVLTARSRERAQASFKELSTEYSSVHYHDLDVSSRDSVTAIKAFVTEKFGRLDILVNNAGINYDTWHSAEAADLEEVAQTLDTNLMGAWRMCQAFVPMMKSQGYDRIVNVSSGAGAIEGMGAGTPGYSVSKAAMNVLTIKLAAEMQGRNVLVNAVCPGWVRTDMGGSAAPRSVEEGASGIVWAATLNDNGPNGGFFRDGKAIAW